MKDHNSYTDVRLMHISSKHELNKLSTWMPLIYFVLEVGGEIQLFSLNFLKNFHASVLVNL